jgi:hypothetical protein
MTEESFFFSEEKKQKTFTSLSRFFLAARVELPKVFWFFFSKKNCFPALVLAHDAFMKWKII